MEMLMIIIMIPMDGILFFYLKQTEAMKFIHFLLMFLGGLPLKTLDIDIPNN